MYNLNKIAVLGLLHCNDSTEDFKVQLFYRICADSFTAAEIPTVQMSSNDADLIRTLERMCSLIGKDIPEASGTEPPTANYDENKDQVVELFLTAVFGFSARVSRDQFIDKVTEKAKDYLFNPNKFREMLANPPPLEED